MFSEPGAGCGERSNGSVRSQQSQSWVGADLHAESLDEREGPQISLDCALKQQFVLE